MSSAGSSGYGQGGYGGNSKPHYGSGPVPSNTQSAATCSISELNPYISKWTIKARVTSKGSLRTWSNARGEGKLFSIDLLDATGGEMRATMFNDVADKFIDVFQEGQVRLNFANVCVVQYGLMVYFK